MDRMACPKAPGEAQVHVLQSGPNVVIPERRWAKREIDRIAAYHGGMACQFVREPVGLIEARERQGLPGARHGHIVQTAWRVPVFAASNAVPPAVEHGHMVEFQPLGAMGGRQQEAALATTHLPPPIPPAIR